MIFSIKSKELIDLTLGLQQINDVALPIAVQNTLNSVVRDIKTRTLRQTTERMFDIKKKSFFKSNSGYKPYKAKQFNYNINKMHADVGMMKSQKANEKATEQVAFQQTATNIDRSINPLGNKPLTKKKIDILSKKPEVYDSSKDYPEGNSIAYIRKAQKAHRQRRGLIIKNASGRGAVNQVKSIKRRNPTKGNPRKMEIKTVPIASYIEDGQVKLTKRNPFLIEATNKSMGERMNQEFIKQARYQFNRVMKKR